MGRRHFNALKDTLLRFQGWEREAGGKGIQVGGGVLIVRASNRAELTPFGIAQEISAAEYFFQ